MGFGTTTRVGALAIGVLAAGAMAQRDLPPFEVLDDGTILADGVAYESWAQYTGSEYFRELNLRCGSDPLAWAGHSDPAGSPADCTYNFTNPAAEYDPSQFKWRIPVVVHIIQHTNGQGQISDALVQSQIDILNEDFLALPGTNGEPGTDVQIEFYLATEDPSGNPTNGITRSTNSTWFNDGGSYWNSLAWDTNRYCNIYTNSASGALGYVPDLPQGGIAGSNSDRIVILWSSFGRNAPIGPPYNKGRTTTHEMGHYLGLWHTFDNGCGSVSGCATSGDRICDTNRESGPVFGCPGSSSSCSSSDPYHNYMDYSDDLCMWEFTHDQARRIRCSLIHYRPNLGELAGPDCPADIDGDGDADGDDFFGYLDLFAAGDPDADLDGDGDRDADDFFTYLDLFANGCP
ncbi:MAG: zinc metalloprotease [Phycisphaeraceae bacterium]|nr:zinc metalloprotease [Phycisphaeraceae bacterium]